MKAEVKGRGKRWKVSYPAEDGIATNVPVFDKEGTLVKVVKAGVPVEDKMTESIIVLTSQPEAEAYARYLGATEITVVRTKAARTKK